jgi:undecaprenyl-diphosphatase
VADKFYALDVAIFRFINHDLGNALFDSVMPFITDVDNWHIIILAFALFLMTLAGRRGRWVFLAIVITVALTDGVISHTLKHWLARPRPFLVLDWTRRLSSAGGGSFPSAHAANMFGFATIVSGWYRSLRWPLFGFAALIAFSRVYVGVHYPSDVAGGGIFGILSGLLVLWMAHNWRGSRELLERRDGDVGDPGASPGYDRQGAGSPDEAEAPVGKT